MGVAVGFCIFQPYITEFLHVCHSFNMHEFLLRRLGRCIQGAERRLVADRAMKLCNKILSTYISLRVACSVNYLVERAVQRRVFKSDHGAVSCVLCVWA